MTQETFPSLLDKASVCQLLMIAPRTLENMVKNNQFPVGVRVGKHVYWSELAVRKWQRLLFAGQEAWQP
uniref:Helix-turn-helix domain-containing protein n=1 Tax=mine drainage metagenome TaxID=410659 RepID=E6QX24_9ZZZZ